MRNIIFLMLLLTGCSWKPRSVEYDRLYAYQREKRSRLCSPSMEKPYLVVLVDARRLDYTCASSFFRTLTKHPSDGSKNSDVGHAWIYLAGEEEESELGHSGELGEALPRYFEGVEYLLQSGDPDPIRYLWCDLQDGFCQKGNGGHRPTYAAKFSLSQEEYQHLRQMIRDYDFSGYSLTVHQCTHFVELILKEIGINVDAEIVVIIPEMLKMGNGKVRLRTNSRYREMSLSTPDMLERELVRLVSEGRAEDVRGWYKKHHPQRKSLALQVNDWLMLPDRLQRHYVF